MNPAGQALARESKRLVGELTDALERTEKIAAGRGELADALKRPAKPEGEAT